MAEEQHSSSSPAGLGQFRGPEPQTDAIDEVLGFLGAVLRGVERADPKAADYTIELLKVVGAFANAQARPAKFAAALQLPEAELQQSARLKLERSRIAMLGKGAVGSNTKGLRSVFAFLDQVCQSKPMLEPGALQFRAQLHDDDLVASLGSDPVLLLRLVSAWKRKTPGRTAESKFKLLSELLKQVRGPQMTADALRRQEQRYRGKA